MSTMLEHDARASVEHDARAHATHGRTDARTNADGKSSDVGSPSVTRTGGQEDFAISEVTQHTHTPHVYVIYWPDYAILKIGISETWRWRAWHRRGAVDVAATDTCCMEHARAIEQWMLKRLAKYGARAFQSQEDARLLLGRHKGGYTECYRLVQSPRHGEQPASPYDYERAYGLILPPEIEDDFARYDFAREAVYLPFDKEPAA